MTNDQLILTKIIDQKKAVSCSTLSDSDFFELFTAGEILKDYDLSFDEIESGNIGMGNDGGMDSIFIFFNGELLREDTDIQVNKKQNHFEIHIIQSKKSPSFNESAIDKLKCSVEDLFNLESDISSLTPVYNEYLRTNILSFRRAYSQALLAFPKLNFYFYYASLSEHVHDNVSRKVEFLEKTVKQLFSDAQFSFQFLGARELLRIARTEQKVNFELEFSENPIFADQGGYVCLVPLMKFHEFLIDDNGQLQRRIFDANVRDYQGSVRVNSAIQDTLKNPGKEDFWFLNNGVTILTPRASTSGKRILIESPQIVNGLQTSFEVFAYFCNRARNDHDPRKILVRVIVENDPDSRDNIIRATNSQTSIPSASLRAADKTQRDIEDFLSAHGLFYERRKNFYKNEGKPITQIISISTLAQSLISIILLKPDFARARPSTLVDRDEDYLSIFNPDCPMYVYLNVIKLTKHIEKFIRDNCEILSINKNNISNLKFHVIMVTTLKHLNQGYAPSFSQLENLKPESISPKTISDAILLVNTEYLRAGESDQTAKGRGLVETLLGKIRETVELQLIFTTQPTP